MKTKTDKIDHLAIVMDGNGRWAQQKGKSRLFGHEQGVVALKNTVKACIEFGIPYLTVFAFSSENWNRPQEEVDGLFSLFRTSLDAEINALIEAGVTLTFSGDFSNLDDITKEYISSASERKPKQHLLTLNVALSYGSKGEILNAARSFARDSMDKKVTLSSLTEEVFESYFYAPAMPPVDILIRTGGVVRTSNFLLWQSAYAEYFFLDIFWPDFTKESLRDVLNEFKKRERRYGLVSEQIQHSS